VSVQKRLGAEEYFKHRPKRLRPAHDQKQERGENKSNPQQRSERMTENEAELRAELRQIGHGNDSPKSYADATNFRWQDHRPALPQKDASPCEIPSSRPLRVENSSDSTGR
jgi:hypothetical protein